MKIKFVYNSDHVYKDHSIALHFEQGKFEAKQVCSKQFLMKSFNSHLFQGGGVSRGRVGVNYFFQASMWMDEGEDYIVLWSTPF